MPSRRSSLFTVIFVKELEKMKTAFVLLLWSGLFCIGSAQTQYIVNGYDHVLVAIDEATSQQDALINKIQDLMQETSNALYTATKGHVFYRSVDILVPSKWNHSTFAFNISTTQSFDVADWIIASQNPAYGDRPYVSQAGTCGEGGQFIHLTEDYVWNTAATKAAGKLLLSKWAQHRYGVFDEWAPYPDSFMTVFTNQYKPFYPIINDQGAAEFHPSVCGQLTGQMQTTSGHDCKLYNGWPEYTCRYNLDADQTLNSSVMYSSEIENVVEFCDDHGPNEHNVLALNEHNDKCGQKSVWSVLRNHSDFKDFHTNAKPSLPGPPATIFNVLQPYKLQRIIFVLDISGSMSGCRIQNLHAVTVASIGTLTLPVSLGIVQFDDTSTILLPVTRLVNATDVKKAQSKVPSSTAGSTCIQCGVDTALGMLSVSGLPSEGTGFVLVSDGDENVGQVMASLPAVKRAGVQINTIGISSAASQLLQTLAKETGGETYFVPDDCGAGTGLLLGIINSVKNSKDVVLATANVTMPTQVGTSSNGSFIIDATLGTKTRINLFYNPTTGFMETTFTDPNGTVYGEGHEGFFIDKQNGIVYLVLETSLPGIWTYNVTRTNSLRAVLAKKQAVGINFGLQAPSDQGLLNVLSQPPEEQKPLLLSVWPSAPEMNFRVSHRMAVYAYLRRETTPVLRAAFTATVTDSNNKVTSVYLYDNGEGEDAMKNDGVYTGSFTNFMNTDASQRYSVEVTASDGPDTAFAAVPGQKEEPTGVFTRSDSTVFSVINAGNADKSIPPGQIKNLQVQQVDETSRSVTLGWTAPGGQYNVGKAKAYDMAYSDNVAKLVPDVSPTAGRLNSSDLGVVPADFMTAQNVTFTIPLSNDTRDNSSFFFRLRVQNEQGVFGAWSNWASTLIITPDPSDLTTAAIMTTTASSKAALMSQVLMTNAVVFYSIVILLSVAQYQLFY